MKNLVHSNIYLLLLLMSIVTFFGLTAHFFEIPLARKANDWRFGRTIEFKGTKIEIMSNFFLIGKFNGAGDINIGGYYDDAVALPSGAAIFLRQTEQEQSLKRSFENAVQQKLNAEYEIISDDTACLSLKLSSRVLRNGANNTIQKTCRNGKRRMEVGFLGAEENWNFFKPQFESLVREFER